MTSHPAYGRRHQQVRALLLASVPRSTPCPICGKPLGTSEPLDLHHSDAAPGVPSEAKRRGEPGDQLAHRSCNRRGKMAERDPAELTGSRQRRRAREDAARVAATSQGRVW